MQRIILLLICLVASTNGAWAAEPRQAPTPQERARTLILLNQPIVMLQATFGLTTPEERIKRIVGNVRALSDEHLTHPVEIETLHRYQQQVVLFTINNKPFMLLAEQDLDEGDDLTLNQAAQHVQMRFENLRHALIQQYSSHYLLISAGKSLLGLASLLLLIGGVVGANRLMSRRLQIQALNSEVSVFLPLRQILRSIMRQSLNILSLLFALIVTYIWLSWTLRLFPWTRTWGQDLGDYAMALLQGIALTLLAALPGLTVVAVIFLITAGIMKLINLALTRIEHGKLRVAGFHPETLGVTRRLIGLAIWLLALSAAYPFLPGANTLAFKGISVFFGLMLTLGSAGVMNHAMSGLVLTYSRALRKGDIIRILEHEGVVTDVGILATKIQTRENYDVTIPNAVVVSGKIINLSSASAGKGLNLTTSVTIGYDVPWRQVHAMLQLAASRSDCVSALTAPLIRQLALQDWYVNYELQVSLLPGTALSAARTELHSQIQDVFNEYGVQIMSPNFISQPDHPVVVRREAWFTPPASSSDLS
ncbi:mechanosensitive ion channel domain-containing protein [Pantoea sp. Pa-EAmG]|uniref:mechanosensitive ion channel family protein n=1 Tax=Pantoea sp. Pa-EAmG TaxID=3043311 RepID=UPI0024AFCBB5|nr:mechanosensitive ion channel domain-containing protein [Pantoea sp. Pa-EAmG]MDI6957926.1 mechanosensitive ion channel [Pantoea sp. Pa-EAmG]